MTALRPGLSTSIVVEWENLRLAEQGRVRAMLAELHRQAGALIREAEKGECGEASCGLFELLVMFDPEEVDEQLVRDAVADCIPADSETMSVRFVPAPGATYYTLKNIGAREATGDIVILLDSDVIPDHGWLRCLLSSLTDERVQVVGGNTFVKPTSLYTRTMALTWFFPPKTNDTALKPFNAFYANNVAFRRRVLLAHPFPEHPGQSRGACAQLAERLIRAGIQPYRNHAAQVDHPPPNGLIHFLLRAAVEGRDQLFDCRHVRGAAKASLVRSLGRAARRWSKAVRRLIRHRRQVGLSWPLVPAAAAIASVYYASYLAGDLLARLSPEWTRRHIQV